MQTTSPPPATIEAVTEILHGVTVVGPYGWLKEQNAQRTRDWIAEQTTYTRAYLADIPGRAGSRKCVEGIPALQTYRDPRKAGERCFFLKRDAYEEQAVLTMREGESDEDIVLLDPVQMTGSPLAAINILALSPNGKLLASAARQAGKTALRLGSWMLTAARFLAIAFSQGSVADWCSRRIGGGFITVHRGFNSPRPCYQAVFWHTFGIPFEEDKEIFFLDRLPNLRLIIAVTLGSQLFLYRAAKLQNPVKWRTVVPEGKYPMVQFAVAGDSLCLVYLKNLAHRVLTFDMSGKIRGELSTPAEGSVQLCHQPAPTDTLFHQFSSFAHPLAIFRYRHGTAVREMDATSPASGHRSSINVKRIRYPAKDGTLIPMFLVSKKDAGANGPAPVFLAAYGGFGTSITPRFTAYDL